MFNTVHRRGHFNFTSVADELEIVLIFSQIIVIVLSFLPLFNEQEIGWEREREVNDPNGNSTFMVRAPRSELPQINRPLTRTLYGVRATCCPMDVSSWSTWDQRETRNRNTQRNENLKKSYLYSDFDFRHTSSFSSQASFLQKGTSRWQCSSCRASGWQVSKQRQKAAVDMGTPL